MKLDEMHSKHCPFMNTECIGSACMMCKLVSVSNCSDYVCLIRGAFSGGSLVLNNK